MESCISFYNQIFESQEFVDTMSLSVKRPSNQADKPITLDDLSFRLERARYWRDRMREEYQDFGIRKKTKRFNRQTTKDACEYFDHYLILDLNHSPRTDEEASCMLFDLVNFPTDMVRERLCKSRMIQ